MSKIKPSSSRERQHPLRTILAIALMAVLGALAGYFGARGADALGLLPDLRMSAGELLALVLLFLPLWWLVVLSHELGHLVGGRLVGSRPVLLVAGPLKLTWPNGVLRLGLNRSLALAGGVANAVPADDRDLVRRQLVMVVGGPGASLLLALLAALAVQVAAGLWAVLLGLTAALSLAIGVITLVPMRSAGFYSDGARILMLLRGGPLAERLGALAVMVSAATAGRLHEVGSGVVARATVLPDGSPDALSGSLLAYIWALARGESALAGRYLDEALAQQADAGPVLRPALLNEGAYFLARHRGEAAAARAYLEQVRGSGAVEAYGRLRAEAAVLLAEGRPAEALAAAAAGLEALERARLGAAAELDRELLRELREQGMMSPSAA